MKSRKDNIAIRGLHILFIEGPKSLYRKIKNRWFKTPFIADTFIKQTSQLKPDAQISRDPILILQMGKVGSMTVEKSLVKVYKSLSINVPIYRRHIITNFDLAEKAARTTRENPVDTLAEIEQGRKLRKMIDENPNQTWKLISIVRDPIARNVATFFQNLNEYIPDWKERYAQNNLGAKDLFDFFFTIKISYKFDIWFDAQIKDVFGIDVFASPFPVNAGYKIFREKNFSLLLFRLEDLNKCATQSMSEFLGLHDFQLVNTNIGDDKEYSELYRAFKEFPFPKDYVEQVYSTRFFRHFYSRSDLERLSERWMRGK